MRCPRWLSAVYRPPHPHEDPKCVRETQRVADYKAMGRLPGPLVLDHARRVYDEAKGTITTLDAKAGEILRTSGGLAVGLVAVTTAFGVRISWGVMAALACLLVAMILATISRHPVFRWGLSDILDVLQGASEVGSMSRVAEWLAASLHQAVENTGPASRWKAARVKWASWAMVAGVAVLLLALAFGPPATPVAVPG
ncbi:MAG: hypothetical protein HQ581_17560 [Planctomycetes bacterium]|nr:hypothetical protein [Planctomycetota bacterium]